MHATTVRIGISARHVHLKQEHADILFGQENYLLTNFKDLYQPGEYACAEKVTIQTAHGKIENVRVLGPYRPETQVEISKTDSRGLKIAPPVRNSGDLDGSAPITLVGPAGIVELEQGCILANRHIHLSPKEAEELHLINEDIVKVEIPGEKGGILYNVHCKIKDSYKKEMHLDVDDANAFLLTGKEDIGYILKD